MPQNDKFYRHHLPETITKIQIMYCFKTKRILIYVQKLGKKSANEHKIIIKINKVILFYCQKTTSFFKPEKVCLSIKQKQLPLKLRGSAASVSSAGRGQSTQLAMRQGFSEFLNSSCLCHPTNNSYLFIYHR